MDCSPTGSFVLLSPSVCSDSCPLSQWCYLTISSSAASSICLHLFQHQSFFQWASFSHQSIGVSASVQVLDYSGLISFRVDWFDLLAVQGTLKSLLQHSLKLCFYRSLIFILLLCMQNSYLQQKPEWHGSSAVQIRKAKPRDWYIISIFMVWTGLGCGLFSLLWLWNKSPSGILFLP